MSDNQKDTVREKMIPILNSSNIEGYHYDEKDQRLIVQFRGDTYYLYSGVPKDVADDFSISLSKGGFLSAKIKGKYPCVKIQDTSEKKEEKTACD